MRRTLWVVRFFVLLIATVATAQVKFFPPDFPPKWYERDLTALKEPSLWESAKAHKTQSYRFLWLRSFHHAISIRIDLNEDGTSSLVCKIAGGATGRPGKLIKNRSFSLNQMQTSRFLEHVERSKFWKLPPVLDDGGVDGAQWIMEGVRYGDYHVVDRWSPQNGEIRSLGLYILRDLAKLKLARNEIY